MPIAIPFSIPIDRTLAAWMIAGARVTGLLVVSPFFGSAALPARIKVGLAFLLTLFLVPLVPATPAALPTSALIVILLGEFAIGFVLGITLQFVFEAGQLAGQVCGVQMGYSLASLMNPDNSQADSSVLSTFYELIVILLFIQLGVPRWLLRGLARSFDYLPPGQLSLTWPAMSALFKFAADNICSRSTDRSARRGRQSAGRCSARFSRQSVAAIARALCRDLAQEPARSGALVRRGRVLAALL